jgi:D-threo-aldose 1-dehydrogenase
MDIVYIHDPDDHYDEALSGALPTLAELRDQGTIRALGVGMNQAKLLRRFISEAQVDYILLANRYTLLDQSAFTDLLPASMERGVSVILGGALNSGILADPVSQPRFDYRPAPPELLAQALRLRDICASHGVPLLAAALQFCAGHPAVDGVLIGARSRREVVAATGALGFPIPDEMWSELKTKGLIPVTAPTGRRHAP